MQRGPLTCVSDPRNRSTSIAGASSTQPPALPALALALPPLLEPPELEPPAGAEPPVLLEPPAAGPEPPVAAGPEPPAATGPEPPEPVPGFGGNVTPSATRARMLVT